MRGEEIAEFHRLEEGHLIHECRDRGPVGVAHRRHGTGLVDRAHDHATVHIAVVVGVHDTHHPGKGDLRLLRGYGLIVGFSRHRVHGHVSLAGGHGP